MESISVCRICVNNKNLINISKNVSTRYGNDLFINIKEKISYALGIKVDGGSKFKMVCINCIRSINQFVVLKLQAVETEKFLQDISIMFKPGNSISVGIPNSQNVKDLYRNMKNTINKSKFTQPSKRERKMVKRNSSSSMSHSQKESNKHKLIKTIKESPEREEKPVLGNAISSIFMENLSSNAKSNYGTFTNCVTNNIKIYNIHNTDSQDDSFSSSNWSSFNKENICDEYLNLNTNSSITPADDFRSYHSLNKPQNDTFKKYSKRNNRPLLKEKIPDNDHDFINTSLSNKRVNSDKYDTCMKNNSVQNFDKNNYDDIIFMDTDIIPKSEDKNVVDLITNYDDDKETSNENVFGQESEMIVEATSASECLIRIEKVTSLSEPQTNNTEPSIVSLFNIKKETELISSENETDSESVYSRTNSDLSEKPINYDNEEALSQTTSKEPIFLEASSKQLYLCNYCPRNYKSKYFLKRHVKNNHSFSCLACKQTYKSQRALNRHVKLTRCSTKEDTNMKAKTLDWKLYLKPVVQLKAFDDDPSCIYNYINISNANSV